MLNVIRFAFLVATGAITANQCQDQTFVTTFCFGAVVLYALSVGADINLVRWTCRGALPDTGRRVGVSKAVSIRFGFMVAEFVTVRTRVRLRVSAHAPCHIRHLVRAQVVIGFVLVTVGLPSCTKLEEADESAYDATLVLVWMLNGKPCRTHPL